MTEDKREELLNSACYFWEEKGRLDGFSGEEDLEKEFPRIYNAWKAYLYAKETVDVEVNHASDTFYKNKIL